MRQFLLCLSIMVSLVAAGGPALASRSVSAGIEQNPPLSYLDTEGHAAGILVDILREIGKKEDWQVHFVPGTLSDGIERLKNSQLDLFVTIAYSAERAQVIDFNDVNVVVNWGQIYTAKGINIQSFLDLQDKRIAVVTNDIHHRALHELITRFGITAKYKPVDKFDDVFRLLDNKDVDAGVVGRIYGMTHEKKYSVTPSTVIFNPIEVRYGFPKGKNSDIARTIDRHLTSMKEDPASAYNRAMERYLQVTTRGVRVPLWMKWILGSTVCVIFFAIGTGWYLKREVRRRTLQLNNECDERRKTEQLLADSEKNYRELVESANSIIIKVDTGRAITFFNDYAEIFFGFTKDEVLGKDIVGTILPKAESSGRDLASLFDSIVSHPEHHLACENENIRKNGSRCWISWSNRPLFDDEGQLTGILSVGQDITKRREYEQQLVYQANHDLLTGLPNRNLLKDRLEHYISLFSRNRGFLGILSLDIDNFNMINDTLGHAAGDQILIDFSHRLQDVIRKSDTLAKLSGDEFIVLPGDITTSEDAAVLAEKILSSMTAPFKIANQELFISVSIGIAAYPSDGDTVDLLLQNAETAMYEVKRSGKNDFRFFTGELNSRIHTRLSLETSLHRALENNEFVLHYQPQVEMSSGTITGMEALLRWKRDDGSITPPMEFIPALEDSGLIVSVGEWVLETACRDTLKMSEAAGRPLMLSVNISARQFQRTDIIDQLAGILEETGFPPELLRLELTESTLMGDTVATQEKLQLLKKLRVSLSIDDFGTGYSSLSYLKRLPISELKIDRAFIKNIPENKSDAVIVTTIITMAQCLDLHVVAEGVETEEQRSFLEKRQCRICQGFLFSRPIPIDQVIDLLLKDKPRSRQPD